MKLTFSMILAGIGIATGVLASRSPDSEDTFAIHTKTRQWTLQIFPDCVFVSALNWDDAQLNPNDYGGWQVAGSTVQHYVNLRDPQRWFRELGLAQNSAHLHSFLGIRTAKWRNLDSLGVDVAVPTWYVIIIAVAPLAWMMYRRTFRRSPAGHCPHCGYDLRATPHRCPECGTFPAAK